MTNHQKSWIFVSVQAVILLLLIVMPSRNASSPAMVKIAAIMAVLVGLMLIFTSAYQIRQSLTAMPEPKPKGKLQVYGLYKYIRHPMYTGVLVFSLGIALYGTSLLKLGLVLGLFILFWFKAQFEEKLLTKKYHDYKAYKAKTPIFLPKLKMK